ncbi:MAG: CYCXC family (seleno)protein [Pyrinomonadaceae bacterium]
MKKNLFIIAIGVLVVVLVALIITQRTRKSNRTEPRATAKTPVTSQTDSVTTKVPAHYEAPPVNLRATLSPEQFSGATRDAYRAAKEIPQTIAQMPCYCHCDRGMGHKSLHSCFEDDHAAHCATCVDEALMAYRLQKQGLTALQIRQKIIAEFAD